jgi:hypothetical protein
MFSSPLSFNDPFEAKPLVDISGTKANVHKFIEKLVRANWLEGTPADRILKHRALERAFKRDPKAVFRNSLCEILNDYAVLSLTEDSLHPLMWSHYSDSHRGICIEFDATMYFFRFAHSIDYSESYPVVDPRKSSPEEINRISILTKAKFWEYEKEWRIILPKMNEQEKAEQIAMTDNALGRHLIGLHNGPGINTFPKECLTAVILGARISPDDANYIVELVKTNLPHARIERAHLNSGAFKLEREAIAV